jgi:hypothetical protein
MNIEVASFLYIFHLGFLLMIVRVVFKLIKSIELYQDYSKKN